MDFLAAHLGGDRLLTRSELDKLTLYAGDGGHIELDDARAVIADSAALSLDDVLLAAAEGDAAALDRALARVFQEGEVGGQRDPRPLTPSAAAAPARRPGRCRCVDRGRDPRREATDLLQGPG